MNDNTGAATVRPRSCPTCHSFGAPRKACQNLWHIEVRNLPTPPTGAEVADAPQGENPLPEREGPLPGRAGGEARDGDPVEGAPADGPGRVPGLPVPGLPWVAPDLLVVTTSHLDRLRDVLDEVRRNVAHGDAQHNPWALRALNVADELLGMVELTTQPAVVAASPAPAAAPGVVDVLAALMPEHAHTNPRLFGFGTRFWRWSTPAGMWLVTLDRPVLERWSLKFEGGGSMVHLPATMIGVEALRTVLAALGAIGGHAR